MLKGPQNVHSTLGGETTPYTHIFFLLLHFYATIDSKVHFLIKTPNVSKKRLRRQINGSRDAQLGGQPPPIISEKAEFWARSAQNRAFWAVPDHISGICGHAPPNGDLNWAFEGRSKPGFGRGGGLPHHLLWRHWVRSPHPTRSVQLLTPPG